GVRGHRNGARRPGGRVRRTFRGWTDVKGRTRAGAGALAALLAVSACSFTEGAGAAGTLRVLAGSELADMEPLLAESAERTGVELVLDYSGTLDGTERVLAGAVE